MQNRFEVVLQVTVHRSLRVVSITESNSCVFPAGGDQVAEARSNDVFPSPRGEKGIVGVAAHPDVGQFFPGGAKEQVVVVLTRLRLSQCEQSG
jgi:hypothetical protein